MLGRMPWPSLPRLGHQLLDPQTQNAAALLREERELVASLQVVVAKTMPGRWPGRWRPRCTGARSSASMACAMNLPGRCPRAPPAQAEHGQRGEAPAHGGLAENTAAHPSSRLALKHGAGVGDGHEVLHQLLFADAVGRRRARHAGPGAARWCRRSSTRSRTAWSRLRSAKMARTRTGESESSVLNVIFDESGLLYS